MFVLITYDVNTEDAAGRKRLRRVARQCEKYGKRVQCSVFECVLDPAQTKQLQFALKEIIEDDKDSLRFYYLGDRYKTRIEHFGIDSGTDADSVLIL